MTRRALFAAFAAALGAKRMAADLPCDISLDDFRERYIRPAVEAAMDRFDVEMSLQVTTWSARIES